MIQKLNSLGGVPVKSPYAGLPDSAFWSRAVAISADEVDPVVSVPFTIGKHDKVATAGSCFAQHIARALQARGFQYLVTEEGDAARNYGLFSARFGNLYTVRQLLQLFDRAYGLFAPANTAWRRGEAWVDAFRPAVEPDGFASIEALEADRATHLAAVRRMFEGCDVFVFTLGLTEGWEGADGAVYPLAPGVHGAPETGGATFRNFTAAEMTVDLRAFLEKLRVVNPDVRVVLTVSPVPLVATYEPRHVLVSNTVSKAALRIVADEVTRADPAIAYFPSYEIVTGVQRGNAFFAPDRREVLPEGVDHVMTLFARHFLSEAKSRVRRKAAPAAAPVPDARAELEALYRVVCDEELIAR